MFTLRDAWREGRAALAQSGVETPQLDSEIIIRYLTCKGREEFYRDLGEPFPAELLARFYQLLRERGRGVPVAYLVGEKEFFGFSFKVTPAVLIPRPETEILVETALELWQQGDLPVSPRILDIGTGSGAIAISLALKIQNAEVVATDVKAEALAVARQNALRLGAKKTFFRHGDLWQALETAESDSGPRSFDLVVSNPPYIPKGELMRLTPELQQEPREALDGGEDGLDFYRRISAGLGQVLQHGGWVLLEVGQGQAPAVRELLAQAGLTVFPPVCDLSGVERVVKARQQEL